MSGQSGKPERRSGARRPAAARRRRARWILGIAALAVAALALRLYGIRWGLPHPGRYYPYHPDESVVIAAVLRLAPFRGEWLPGFYNYGSLYLLLCRIAIDFAAGYHLVQPNPGPMPAWAFEFARLILIGRLVTVTLSVGTVVLTALTARRLYGASAGWLAGLFLAVAPMHVVLSHYMTVDVPAAFFTTLCLYAAARAVPPRTLGGRATAEPGPFRPGRWLGIGAAAGLAASAKYNVGVIGLVGLVPLTLRYPFWSRLPGGDAAPGSTRPWRPLAHWFAGVLLLAAGAAAAFAVTTPGSVLEPSRFQADFLFELQHTRRGHGDLFKALPPSWQYHLDTSLGIGLGWPLLACALLGVAWAIWRRRPAECLLLAAVLPLYGMLAAAELRFVRYVVPLLPPLCILAAGFLVWMAAVLGRATAGPRGRRARGRVRAGRGAAMAAFWTLAICSTLVALAGSVAHDRALASEDPREAAARWVLERLRPGERIALASDPWFRTPPIDPTAGCVKAALPFGGPPAWDPRPGEPDRVLAPVPFHQGSLLVPEGFPHPAGPLPVADLNRFRPDRVIISDYEYGDPLRIRALDPGYGREDGLLRLWDELQRSYRLEEEFTVRPELCGLEWFRGETPPHDWAYFMPTIQVYRRVK